MRSEKEIRKRLKELRDYIKKRKGYAEDESYNEKSTLEWVLEER